MPEFFRMIKDTDPLLFGGIIGACAAMIVLFIAFAIYRRATGRRKEHEASIEEYSPSLSKIPTADVVPKSEEGAKCPICHGTGRIGTTDWLTKNISKKQLAEEKAKAIAEQEAEHERHIKTEVAREIFEEIEKCLRQRFSDEVEGEYRITEEDFAELKKKYIKGDPFIIDTVTIHCPVCDRTCVVTTKK